MTTKELPNSWLDQVAEQPVADSSTVLLNDRLRFPEFIRYTYKWPGSVAQVYNFCDATVNEHRVPCVVVAAHNVIDRNSLSDHLSQYDASDVLGISLATGETLYHALMRIMSDNTESYDVGLPPSNFNSLLRKAEQSAISGVLVDHWIEFARKYNKSSIVFYTTAANRSVDVAEKAGFYNDGSVGNFTYWKRDI